MAMMERPQVRETDGGKCWEHSFEKFDLKAYVPKLYSMLFEFSEEDAGFFRDFLIALRQ